MGLSKDDDDEDDDDGGGGDAPSSSADRSTPLTLWAALPHMPGSGPKRREEGRGGKSARAVCPSLGGILGTDIRISII